MIKILKLTILKEDLYNDYVVEGMSTRDIGKKYNVAQTNVRRMMSFYGIKTRNCSEKTEYYMTKMRPKWDVYKESNKKWHKKKCEWCGNEFDIDYQTKNKKYCSENCMKEYFKSIRKKYYCENCGEEIEYKDRNYKRKYCDECFEDYKKEPKYDRIKTNCGYCGKEIHVIKSRFKSNKYCYCNTDCMSKHYSQIYTGENSPTWTGGKRHYEGGWLAARKEARKRDKYTCQYCGITEEEYDKEMSVHHIKKYKSFEDKKKANELSNLVCLCEPCHRFIHSNKNINKDWIKE